MIHLKLCYIVYVHWVTKIRSVQFCVCCLGTFGKWMVEHIVLRKKDKLAEVMKIVILKSSLVRYKIYNDRKYDIFLEVHDIVFPRSNIPKILPWAIGWRHSKQEYSSIYVIIIKRNNFEDRKWCKNSMHNKTFQRKCRLLLYWLINQNECPF